MGSEWKECRIGEIGQVIMGQSPPGYTYNEQGVGIPFFQGAKDFGKRYPTRRVYCTAPTRIAAGKEKTMTNFTESVIEQVTLDWFEGLGYSILNGPAISPGELFAERASYRDVLLEKRVRSALENINPSIPQEALEDAYRRLAKTIHESPLLAVNNQRFHKMLTDGVDVEYKDSEGRIVGDKVWLIDFGNPDNNDWLAVNQFTVIEGQYNRCPDIVVFVNGIPLGVIELKNPSDESATIRNAFSQIQTYKNDIPSLFPYNEILIVSDGIEARLGTLTSDWEWFLPWRTIEGEDVAPKGLPELEVLIKGIFEKQRFIDLLRYFIVFEVDGHETIKKTV